MKTSRIQTINEALKDTAMFCEQGPRALRWFKWYSFTDKTAGHSISKTEARKYAEWQNINLDEIIAAA